MTQMHLNQYEKLIQDLLSCTEDEKWILLRQYADLIDFELIQMMEQVAQKSVRNGGHEEGNDLHQLARKLYHLLIQDESTRHKSEVDSAYDIFIQTFLLTCSGKDQERFLISDQNLLGSGLIHRMQQIAQQMVEKGDLAIAQRLWSCSEAISRRCFKAGLFHERHIG